MAKSIEERLDDLEEATEKIAEQLAELSIKLLDFMTTMLKQSIK